MKTIEILGENRFAEQTKTRVACRGMCFRKARFC